MALQMDYTDEMGVNHPQSYWKIQVIEADFTFIPIPEDDDITSTFNVRVLGFHDTTTRQDNKKQIAEFKCSFTNLSTFSGEIRDLIYTQLKTLDFFSGATDA